MYIMHTKCKHLIHMEQSITCPSSMRCPCCRHRNRSRNHLVWTRKEIFSLYSWKWLHRKWRQGEFVMQSTLQPRRKIEGQRLVCWNGRKGCGSVALISAYTQQDIEDLQHRYPCFCDITSWLVRSNSSVASSVENGVSVYATGPRAQ